MIVDCERCEVRGTACQDCVITVLFGPPDLELDAFERRGIDLLARGGLIPRLRLVPAEPDLASRPRQRRRSA